ncbi:FtsK/SpoIIIE domain-containing protein [Pseudonocardia alni]|uniref:S-DNA-T family DNA segregation ATPase FtsK/SpoIIIE n=1 Tax=Pseudonocardia alni TaxID=33907 RepID=A0A852VZ13_PSEA5|nr:FtsK/SpoIIIE domain-containing protein [Pseudonocardia antarctica]NYG01330.1 S-DNA-T family DNA segregation ATPase FtsK/SpoIIIE [Pseudonocardia antarctica]
MVLLIDAPERRTRRERYDDHRDAEALAWAWRLACEGSGLCRSVDTPTGATITTPKVTAVRLGRRPELVVALQPGQLPADVRAVAHRLAPALGGVALRVEPRGLTHVRVTVLDVDPLADVVPPVPPVRSALDPLILGRDEGGDPATLDLSTAAHVIVQGASGSGKSVGCYSLLAQLAGAPDVVVAGSDITGLLLAPWAGHAPSGLVALGTRDPDVHLAALARLVDLMDQRIAAMPAHRDAVALDVDTPVVLAVVEELPGLLRVLDQHGKEPGQRGRTMLGRLLGEGRKAGIRCLLVTQRADAKIIGGYERGQASHTLSFRIDSASGLSMLHSGVTADQAAAHATAAPGVALLSAPGVPLSRLRAPRTTFAGYVAAVAGPLAA